MADEKKKPDWPKKPPSEEFQKAFMAGIGSQQMICDFCGRNYFCPEGDWTEGELERYRQRAKEEPEKYIETDTWSSGVTVDGQDYVWDCKCNAIRRYEDWIWNNRHRIMEYIKTTHAEILRDLQGFDKILRDADENKSIYDALTDMASRIGREAGEREKARLKGAEAYP